MYAADIYRPGYNPEFLRRVREKQRREKLAKKAALPVEAVKVIEAPAPEVPVCEPLPADHEAHDLHFAIGVYFGLLAKQAVERTITPADRNRELIRSVAAKRGVSFEEVIGPSRNRNVVQARFDAILAVRRANPNLSLPQIGRMFGNRDHTSILHALRKRGMFSGVISAEAA